MSEQAESTAEDARATLHRLAGRSEERTREHRRHGVAGLLPELVDSPTVRETLGEVPEGYLPGGYVGRPLYVLGDGVDLDTAPEAVERVREFMATYDTHFGVDGYNEVIATAYPPGGVGIDSVDLLASDLRLLVGIDDPCIGGETTMASERDDYVEVYEDEDGKTRWRFRDGDNDNIMADSGQGYDHERDALHGIAVVTKRVPAIVQTKTSGPLDEDFIRVVHVDA